MNHIPQIKNLCTLLVMLVILSISITGCGGRSQEPLETGEQPGLEVEPEEVGEDIPDNVFFWGFDDGPPEGWELSPGWQFEAGSAVSKGPGQTMFSTEPWRDFNLFARIQTEASTAVSLFLRANEGGNYQLIFEPGILVFLSEQEGSVEEQVFPEHSLEPGWHEIHVVLQGGFLLLEVDGEFVTEFEGLEGLQAGSVGFLHHSEDDFFVDYIEIHALEETEEELAADESAAETQAAPGYEVWPDMVIEQPPVASLVDVSSPDNDYKVQVSGSQGAVQPGSLVSVANLATTRVYFADAADDGSFDVEIFAHPGTSIQIKHATFDFFNQEERSEVLAEGKSIEIIHEWANATTGTILRVPDGLEQQSGTIPFAVNGFIFPGAAPYWHVEGMISPLNSSPENMHLNVEGTLTLTAAELASLVDIRDFNPAMHVSLVRHFGHDGDHEVIRKYMISDFLTPTGFPIYHGEFVWSPITRWVELNQWEQISEDSISVDFEFELLNEDRLPIGPGYYGLQFEMIPAEDLEPIEGEGPIMRAGVLYANGGFYSPTFELGSPEQPRLQWGLLTNTLHEATRGATAREDIDHLGLIPMISFQDQKFILPGEDSRTGEPIAYRLEPYLPLIAYGDRGLPNPPTIDFAFPSGELMVTVTKPDGSVEELGPAPFVQSVNTTPSYPFGKVLDYSNGGGAMQEVYQLTTLDEAFDYSFDQTGHYEIEMRGTIDDVVGNTYGGGGTYDVYVAQPLKVYNGMLPTTPFVEGDRFSPSLQVYPRVPAEVEIKLTFLPDSSVERAVEQIFSGKANEFGYFYPTERETFTFQSGGEYRVDLTATYVDETGALWMGSATWGNIVENADTRFIAHGIRGLDSPDANGLWYFHDNLEIQGIFHTYFPYYSGDIFWGFQDPRPDSEVKGADAILPGVSLEDTSGQIYSILKRSWQTKAHAAIAIESMEDAIADGQVISFSTTRSGMDLGWFPDQVDQFGYAYMSSERPGARVHESIGEGGIPVSYWRYDGTFGDQVGVEGDLPNDLKWQFGGVVFRDAATGINDYGAYASLWVLAPNDDPMGARVTPPFQGATGGPNGGPILVLHGEDIDLLFLPRSGFPGQILEVGETLSISGHVGPPLDSKLTIQVTSPSGDVYTIEGQANKVGYFYQPEDDILVDEPGVWRVQIEVLHDGMTSSGPTVEPYPTGGVLGAQGGDYEIYVVEATGASVEITAPAEGHLQFSGAAINPIPIRMRLPAGFENARYSYTIAMPGYILEQGQGTAQGSTIELSYDPASLNKEYPNLDVTAYDYPRPGLADQVWITVLLESGGRSTPATLTFHGEEVFHR